jgi:hypothetical protein
MSYFFVPQFSGDNYMSYFFVAEFSEEFCILYSCFMEMEGEGLRGRGCFNAKGAGVFAGGAGNMKRTRVKCACVLFAGK